jgi:16S rRNA (cytidine1402-2'-O)-methyltransferase
VAGTLYLVGTPIGNLEDITERARRVLGAVDLIAAEDTRRTGRLLAALGIEARLLSFFDANEDARIPGLVERLRSGADVALVSDAGMPGISDPGYRLVRACIEAEIPVDVVPGPSAALAALVISGLPLDRFVFEGFLPRSGRARSARIAALATEARTIVLFESPRRVGTTLQDLRAALGDRRVAVARELTKLHQEVVRGSLSEALATLEGRTLKGEVALVIEGAGPTAFASGEPRQRAVAMAEALVAGGARKREAARRAAQDTGIPSGEIYRALAHGDGK